MKLPVCAKSIRKCHRSIVTYKKLLRIDFSSKQLLLLFAFAFFGSVTLGKFLFDNATWSLERSSLVGDTIGGITAPFINLIAVYLVWRSFQAQAEANKIQSDALITEREKISYEQQAANINTHIVYIREDINYIPYEDFIGIPALVQYGKFIRDSGARGDLRSDYSRTYDFVIRFTLLLQQFADVLHLIDKSSLSADDKRMSITILKVQYRNKLELHTLPIFATRKQLISDETPIPPAIENRYKSAIQILEAFELVNNDLRKQFQLNPLE